MIEDITKTVEWYKSIGRDFRDVNTLMSARRSLACNLGEMATQLALLYEQRNGCEFQRKNAHAEILRREMGVEKTTVSAAKIIADSEIKECLEREYDADSQYQKAKILYDAWRNVCDVMNQHISNLKSERSLEYNGQGSQQI